jgi:hypothetical protein
MYPWPIGVLIVASAVSFIFGAIGVWSLWRVRRLLAVMPVVRDRLDTLTNSMTLLTDTTESCFKALAVQLQFMQAQYGAPSPVTRVRAQAAGEPPIEVTARKARQRRVVGAARRGETHAAIAAREDMAESEIALRLHLNRETSPAGESKHHGALHS